MDRSRSTNTRTFSGVLLGVKGRLKVARVGWQVGHLGRRVKVGEGQHGWITKSHVPLDRGCTEPHLRHPPNW